jgi:hypothetical protein
LEELLMTVDEVSYVAKALAVLLENTLASVSQIEERCETIERRMATLGKTPRDAKR